MWVSVPRKKERDKAKERKKEKKVKKHILFVKINCSVFVTFYMSNKMERQKKSLRSKMPFQTNQK